MGVTGREVKSAYARSNTWGVANTVSLGKQVLLQSTEGLDDKPVMVDDDAFNQDFIAESEVSQRAPIISELRGQARYENLDSWFASACGSAANPTVVSSVAANSLVAYSHTITLASKINHFYTLAVDMVQYVKEIPTFKLRGFNLTTGDNGVMNVSFPIVGQRTKYDSAVNTAAVVAAAPAATIGFRLFRKDCVIRMNIQSAGSLGNSDIQDKVKSITFNYARPMAQDDFVFGSDSIIEPEDDGAAEFMVEHSFPRMNTVSANSLAIAFGVGRPFKADWKWLGPYVNSQTQRQFLIETPSAIIYDFKAPVVGHNQVRPVVQWQLKRTATAPSGMAGLTNPMRLTIVNSNSANLLA